MTIRKRILILFLSFSIIPILFFSILKLFNNVSTIEALHTDRLNKMASISASALTEIIELHKNEIRLLSKNENINNYLNIKNQFGFNSEEEMQNREELIDYFSLYLDSLGTFEDMVLLDAKGKVIVGYYNQTINMSLSQTDYYLECLKNQDPEYVYVSKVNNSLIQPDDPNEKCLALSKAIWSDNEILQGVIVAYVNKDILAGFTKSISFGKTGLAFIIDSDNYILYHQEKEFFNTYTKAPKIANLIKRYKKNEIPQIGLVNDILDGEKRTYLYTILDNGELALILRQDYDEYTQNIRREIVFAITSIGLTILFGIFFSLRMSSSFTEPIVKLSKAFSSGREEGKYIVCNLDKNDEIGLMAKSYNNMIQTLERQFDLINSERAKNEYMAQHDGITGLYNRNAFKTKLSELLLPDTECGVFFIDLDGFKKVNDIYGHPIGDELLIELGNRLMHSKVYFELCSRVGGDEFMMAKRGSSEELHTLAKIILEELRVPFFVNENKLDVTVSVGVAIYPNNGSNVDELIKNSDLSMYRAKNQGKNKVFFCDEEIALE